MRHISGYLWSAATAAVLLCSGCAGSGGRSAPIVSGISARLLNASSGSQAITLVATAHGSKVTIGAEPGGKASAYVAVPFSSVSAGNDQTTFTAYAGTSVVATVVAQIAPGTKQTIVYQAPPKGGNGTLVPVPDNPVTNPTGTFTFNLINVSGNFGGPVDLYFSQTVAPSFDEAANLKSIALGSISNTRTITAQVLSNSPNWYLDITPAGQLNTVLSSVAFPNNTFSASGNFSVYFVDSGTGTGSQIVLVDDTGS